MMYKKFAALGVVSVLALTLSACAGSAPAPSGGGASTEQPIGGDVIAPVTVSVNELQGTEIELRVGQVLNINTDSLAVDSYTGEVADPQVATFTAGRKSDGAQFNPGVTGVAAGSTEVTMKNAQGGIQDLVFTVNVVAK